MCSTPALADLVGRPEYVRQRGVSRMGEERSLLARLPGLPDIQCAWLLLLLSGVPRANHLLRIVPPSLIAEYARDHDDAVWNTFCDLMGASSLRDDAAARAVASLPAR